LNRISEAEAYWQEYLASLPQEERFGKAFEIWRFGNSQTLANEIAPLVRSGKKTATSDLLWEIEPRGRKLPKVGDSGIVTNWDGDPLCIVEVTHVEVKAFDYVDEGFVFDYGEGERSLDWWRDDMWNYYSEVCKRLNREPSRDMPIVCERFRLSYNK